MIKKINYLLSCVCQFSMKLFQRKFMGNLPSSVAHIEAKNITEFMEQFAPLVTARSAPFVVHKVKQESLHTNSGHYYRPSPLRSARSV